MTEQEGRKFINYTDKIAKIPINNPKIERERDRLVSALNAMKIPLGQALLRFSDEEERIDIEIKDPINNLCDWVAPIYNYKVVSREIISLRQDEIEKIIDAVEKIITITNEIEQINVAANEIVKDEIIDDKETSAFVEMIKARCAGIRNDLEAQGGITKSKLHMAKAITMDEFNVKTDERKERLFDKVWGDEFAKEYAITRRKKE